MCVCPCACTYVEGVPPSLFIRDYPVSDYHFYFLFSVNRFWESWKIWISPIKKRTWQRRLEKTEGVDAQKFAAVAWGLGLS